MKDWHSTRPNRRVVCGILTLGVACWAPLLAAAETPPPKAEPKETTKNKFKPVPRPSVKPKHSPEIQYLIDLATVHRQYGHIDAALPLLNKAIEMEKDADLRVGILQAAGETSLADGKRAGEAAEYFAKAIDLTEDEERKNILRLWVGGAYRTAKDFSKAEAAFWAAYQGFSEERQRQDALRQLLELLNKAERIEAAQADYEKRSAERPDDVNLREVLLSLYLNGSRRDPKKAVPLLERVCAADPGNVDELQKLAALYQQTGQAAKAVDVYQKVVAHKPNEIEKLARALALAGKRDDAAATLRKSIEGKEQDPVAVERAAQIMDELGMAKEALGLREGAMALIKDEKARAEARFRLAEGYRLLKEHGKSEALLRTIVKESTATQPPAELAAEDAKQYMDWRQKTLGRAKKALVQLYEETGRMAELEF